MPKSVEPQLISSSMAAIERLPSGKPEEETKKYTDKKLERLLGVMELETVEVPDMVRDWIINQSQKLNYDLRKLFDTQESFEDYVKSVVREYKQVLGDIQLEQGQKALAVDHEETKEAIPDTETSEGIEDEEKQAKIETRMVQFIQEKIEEIARADQRDELTQLYTRDAYLRFGVEQLKKHEDSSIRMVAVMWDADFFKSFNDTYGHKFGDLMLQTLSKSLMETTAHLNHEHMDARLGGEELGSMLMLADNMSAREVVELIAGNMGDAGNGLLGELAFRWRKIDPNIKRSDVKKMMFNVLTQVRSEELDDEIIRNHAEEFKGVKDKLVLAGWKQADLDKMSPHEIYYNIEEKYNDLNSQFQALLAEESEGQKQKKYSRKRKHQGHQEISELRKQMRRVKNVRNDLVGCVSLGTITAGFAEVDLSQVDSEITEKDIQFVDRHACDTQEDEECYLGVRDFQNVFEKYLDSETQALEQGITYVQFKELIEKEIGNLQETLNSANEHEKAFVTTKIAQWERLLDQVYARRVGRFIDKANSLSEDQKHEKRNEVGSEKLTLEELDSNEVTSPESTEQPAEEGRERGSLSQDMLDRIQDMNQSLDKELEQLQKEELKEPFDRRLRFFKKFSYLVERGGVKAMSWTRKTRADTEDVSPSEIKASKIKLPKWLSSTIEMVKNRLVDNKKVRYFENLTLSVNDRYLSEQTELEIQDAIRHNKDYCFGLLDLDNLKAVNESMGSNHRVGDVVLKMLALRKRQAFRRWTKEGNHSLKFIRVSGGEECVETFSGMKDEEIAERLDQLGEKIGAEIQGFLDIVKVNLNEEALENVMAMLKEEGISKDLSEISLLDTTKYWIHKKLGRSGEALNKIGTVTAGVVNVRELDASVFEKKGYTAVGILHQITDKIGAIGKKMGRGKTYTLKHLEQFKAETVPATT